MGVKENQKTTNIVIDGRPKEVTKIVTQGGEFKDGDSTVKASRADVDYS